MVDELIREPDEIKSEKTDGYPRYQWRIQGKPRPLEIFYDDDDTPYTLTSN